MNINPVRQNTAYAAEAVRNASMRPAAQPAKNTAQAHIDTSRDDYNKTYLIYDASGKARNVNQFSFKKDDAATNIDAAQAAGKDAATGSSTDGDTVCETCAARRYQDESSDAGVSFKVSGRIDSSVSAAMVAGHEREHALRESQRAQENGQEVLYTRIRVHMEQCPECKKMYSSGGETQVVKTSANNVSNMFDLYHAILNPAEQLLDLLA